MYSTLMGFFSCPARQPRVSDVEFLQRGFSFRSYMEKSIIIIVRIRFERCETCNMKRKRGGKKRKKIIKKKAGIFLFSLFSASFFFGAV